MSEIELTQFGFKFGPGEYIRMAELGDGSTCVRVQPDAGKPVEIYVSPKGRSVRVFRDGKELK